MGDIRDVRFTAAPERERAGGLLGWLQVTVPPGVVVDGIALRRSRHGRLLLSYPERVGRDGTRHPIVRPVNDRVRCDIESRVFAALGLKRDA